MPAKYVLTVQGDTLPELIGALLEAASVMSNADTGSAIAAELAPLAAPFPDAVAGTPLDVAPYPNSAIPPAPQIQNGAPLPTPPPDYQAAGLTEWQAMQARAAAAAVAPPPIVPAAAAPPPNVAGAQPARPHCPVHLREMEWKGGVLSKSGKALPLWSCPDRNCREAIWPPRP